MKILPVKTRNTAETIDVLNQAIDDLRLGGLIEVTVLAVTLGVLGQELTAHRLGGGHIIIAVVADPLRQVIGDVKGGGGRDGVFVVDKVDVGDVVFRFRAILCWENNHVGAKKITVRENELQEKNTKKNS